MPADGWRFFDRACDANGNRFRFNEIDHEVTSSAWTKETFAVDLSREYLDIAKSSGLDIKVIGKRGEKIFVLPAFYIEGFLKKWMNI